MKIPFLTLIATTLFFITHIIETVVGYLLMTGSWSFVTLILNLITVLIPLLFLAGMKAAYEALKIIAIITIVYGVLLIYLNFTEENAYGEFSSFMLVFNSIEILVGIFLYFSLFRVKTPFQIGK